MVVMLALLNDGATLSIAFGPSCLGDLTYHGDHSHLEAMMYLMLSAAGQLTIYLTRTRGPFGSIRLAPILWLAVLGTQILATLFAVKRANALRRIELPHGITR